MKRWVCASFALSLTVACEKPRPFEYTVPAAQNGVTPPFVRMDAGAFGMLDASLALADGAQLEPPAPTEAFTKVGLLTALADCSLARYREFAQRASVLRDATRAQAAAPSAERRAAAQAAWREAMHSWQASELFRFGPTGSSGTPGGKDYRNAIYFFPDASTCVVDQQIVSQGYQAVPLNVLVSARGLGALEYLLFHDGSDNTCSSAITINTGSPSPWQQLSEAELTRRRAAYAAALGDELVRQAQVVLDAWEPGGGNFYTQFSRAGSADSKMYTSEQAAFNVVDDALFYVDKELKDYKVAVPAGLSIDCTATTCPSAVESRLSQQSNDNIVQNLRGFRMIYQGCGANFSGLGFDDYLVAVGHADLAARLQLAIASAQRAADTLPAPLEELLSSDLGRVYELHAAIKGVSDLLKSEFVSALNLELPAMAQGDND